VRHPFFGRAGLRFAADRYAIHGFASARPPENGMACEQGENK
jgi:hypothetical protein